MDDHPRCWIGVDWAGQSHTICCLDDKGQPCWTDHVAREQEQIKRLVRRLRRTKGTVSIAIETAHGLLFEGLMSTGLNIYAVTPKRVKS